VRMPDVPVLSARFGTVIAVDEHEVDDPVGPGSADVLATRQMPPDNGTAAKRCAPHGQSRGGRIGPPSLPKRRSAGEEWVNEMKLGSRSERSAQDQRRGALVDAELDDPPSTRCQAREDRHLCCRVHRTGRNQPDRQGKRAKPRIVAKQVRSKPTQRPRSRHRARLKQASRIRTAVGCLIAQPLARQAARTTRASRVLPREPARELGPTRSARHGDRPKAEVGAADRKNARLPMQSRLGRSLDSEELMPLSRRGGAKRVDQQSIDQVVDHLPYVSLLLLGVVRVGDTHRGLVECPDHHRG